MRVVLEELEHAGRAELVAAGPDDDLSPKGLVADGALGGLGNSMGLTGTLSEALEVVQLAQAVA